MFQYLFLIITISVAVFGSAIVALLFTFGVLRIPVSMPALYHTLLHPIKLVRSLGFWNFLDTPVRKVGAVLIITGIIFGVGGYIYLHIWEKENAFVTDFYANAAAELTSIGITVLIIDRLSAQYAAQEDKKRILRQISSPSHDFALEAVRLARENGWLEDGSLEGANLRWAKLQGANLNRAKLKGANLEWANLQGGDLLLSNLQGVNLRRATLQKATLLGATLQEATLGWANLQEAFLGMANLKRANLEGVNLQEATLSYANLEGAILSYAKLERANLQGANLQGATLQAANLQGAILTATKLPEVNLPEEFKVWTRGNNMPGANLRGAIYSANTIWPNGFDPNEAGAIKVE